MSDVNSIAIAPDRRRWIAGIFAAGALICETVLRRRPLSSSAAPAGPAGAVRESRTKTGAVAAG